MAASRYQRRRGTMLNVNVKTPNISKEHYALYNSCFDN